MSAFNVRVGLQIEEVDATLLVLDPASTTVFELTGEQAEAFRLAQAGVDAAPDHLTAAMAGLVELGLVTAPGWDRRMVLLAGGAVAAAAVVAVALPSAATAQSAPGGGGGGTDPTTTTTTEPANQPPQPHLAAFRSSGPAPFSTAFFASQSFDPDGTIVSYAWDFGDGQTDTGVVRNHTYTSPGTYTCTLTVTDDLGATGTASTVITVTAPP